MSVRIGPVHYATIAADSFGNALGNAVVGQIGPVTAQNPGRQQQSSLPSRNPGFTLDFSSPLFALGAQIQFNPDGTPVLDPNDSTISGESTDLGVIYVGGPAPSPPSVVDSQSSIIADGVNVFTDFVGGALRGLSPVIRSAADEARASANVVSAVLNSLPSSDSRRRQPLATAQVGPIPGTRLGGALDGVRNAFSNDIAAIRQASSASEPLIRPRQLLSGVTGILSFLGDTAIEAIPGTQNFQFGQDARARNSALRRGVYNGVSDAISLIYNSDQGGDPYSAGFLTGRAAYGATRDIALGVVTDGASRTLSSIGAEFVATSSAGAIGSTQASSELVTTFRGVRSSLTPDNVFQNGLVPKGDNLDLLRHVTATQSDSGFVATSQSFDVAQGFAGRNGYVYEVVPEGGINVNETLGSTSPFPEQLEVAIPGPVAPTNVFGAYPLRGGVPTGEFIPNPFFGTKVPK